MVGAVVFNEDELRKLQRGEGHYRGVAEELHERAERVLEKAKADAPVLTGAYRDGLHIEESVVDDVLEVRVAGDTDHDIYVEADTGNLVRSLDAGGGD